jgi:hypothetical protein
LRKLFCGNYSAETILQKIFCGKYSVENILRKIFCGKYSVENILRKMLFFKRKKMLSEKDTKGLLFFKPVNLFLGDDF